MNNLKYIKKKSAIAVFQRKLSGYVRFTQTDKKGPLRISGNIKNLKPGKHGFHIHVYGNLLKTDCNKCGGHFNPTNKNHGGRKAKISHAGDLGNIIANEKGIAKFYFKTPKLTLFGNNNILGRSIVVHEDEDDLGKGGFKDSLTTGHSGARLDCAVIGLDK